MSDTPDYEHNHTYSTLGLPDVTHDHKQGGPHIHNGLTDDDYLKRVAAREKAAAAPKAAKKK